MEVLGQPWTEAKLLQMAYQIEQLSKVRKMPAWARQVVAVEEYDVMPRIASNRDIPPVYPLGTL